MTELAQEYVMKKLKIGKTNKHNDIKIQNSFVKIIGLYRQTHSYKTSYFFLFPLITELLSILHECSKKKMMILQAAESGFDS